MTRHPSLQLFPYAPVRPRSASSSACRVAPGFAALATILCACGSAPPTEIDMEEPEGLRIARTDSILLGPGDTLTLSVTNAEPDETVSWTSSDTTVVQVDSNGRVTARGRGTARIFARPGQDTERQTSQLIRVFAVTGESPAPFAREIARFMWRWNTPGASVAAIQNGRLVAASGIGVADTVSGALVQPTTLFRVASVSKPITATAAMTLLDDDLLELGAFVFPEILTDLWPPGDAGIVDDRLEFIRVEDLLTHAGGWIRPPNDPMFMPGVIADSMGVASPPRAEDIIRYMLGQMLDFDPSTQRYYSNFGYAMLGRVLERLSGTTYEQTVLDRVFGPAGTTNPRIGRSLPADRPAEETSYYAFEGAALATSVFDAAPGQVPWPDGGFHLEAMDAHGGWIASAVDLARFLSVVDGDPTVPDIIEPTTRFLMGHVPPTPGNIPTYAFGWFRIGDAWWHSGRLPGSASFIKMRPDGLAYVGLFNSSDPRPSESLFLGMLQGTMDLAVMRVLAWPDVDLFTQY